MEDHLTWKKSTKLSDKLRGIRPDIVDHRIAVAESILEMLKKQEPKQLKAFYPAKAK
jgi:hypothetical protein